MGDQLARPLRGRCHDRQALCPGLEHDIAQGLVPRRAGQDVGRGHQRRHVVTPAEEADTLCKAEALDQAGQRRALRPVAAEPEMHAGCLRHRMQQHVETLDPVQPAQRQHEDGAVRRVEIRTRRRRRRPLIGEIGEVMDPVGRPALLDEVCHNIACIPDQMIAAPIVLQIIIAAEPGNAHEPAARHDDRRPVHPGQHDLRLPVPHQPAQRPAGAPVEP